MDVELIITHLDPKKFNLILMRIPRNAPDSYWVMAEDIADALRRSEFTGYIALVPNDVEVELGQAQHLSDSRPS